MNAVESVGYLASLLVFFSFWMKTMIPLRLVAITSNVAFMTYGFLGSLQPVFLLHAVLLPVNVHRLLEIRRMTRTVEEAAAGELDFSVLVPYMTRLKLSKGEVLFNKDEEADKFYYVASGEIYLKELGKSVTGNELLGEIAVLSPEGKRTATATCTTDCELYSLDEYKIKELYYQNPAFGFALLRLITQRLIENSRPAG